MPRNDMPADATLDSSHGHDSHRASNLLLMGIHGQPPCNNGHCVQALRDLQGGLPDRLRRLFHRIDVSSVSKPDKEHRVPLMQGFGRELRQRLNRTKQSIVALVGPDIIQKFAHVASQAVTPGMLRHKDRHVHKSVILASMCGEEGCAEHDYQHMLQRAVQLAADERMKGRMGVVFKDKILALPGLVKIREPEDGIVSYDTRFEPIGSQNAHSSEWAIFPARPWHLPQGYEEGSFVLEPNVSKILVANGGADAMEAARQGMEQETLRGAVLCLDKSSEAFADPAESEVLREIDTLNIPSLLVNARVPSKGTVAMAQSGDVSPLDFFNIHDARHLGMNPTEAKWVLRHWLGTLEQTGEITDAEAVRVFIRTRLETYLQ